LTEKDNEIVRLNERIRMLESADSNQVSMKQSQKDMMMQLKKSLGEKVQAQEKIIEE